MRRSEPPEIIEPHDVIRMRMRIKDCIQILNVFAQDLDSEFGTGVHHP
jgi:hypothetical protein